MSSKRSARDTLGAITAVANERSGSSHPLVLVTAELPNRLDLEHLTYFRDRAQQLPVGLLSTAATRDAIAAPARDHGVTWDRTALDAIANASGGYPYAIQVYAHATWRAAAPGEHITLDAAQEGKRRGFEQMGRLYQSRWGQPHPPPTAIHGGPCPPQPRRKPDSYVCCPGGPQRLPHLTLR